MQTKDLRRLMFMLNHPIGFKDYKAQFGSDPDPRVVTERLRDLAIPDRAGKVSFHDTLEAIGKKELGEIELPVGSEAEKNLRLKYGDMLKETGLHNTEVSQHSSAYIFNVIRMQAAFRRRKAFRQRHPEQAKKAAAAAKASIIEEQQRSKKGGAAVPKGKPTATPVQSNRGGKPKGAGRR
jgi:hypothetical protein